MCDRACAGQGQATKGRQGKFNLTEGRKYLEELYSVFMPRPHTMALNNVK